MCDYNTKTENKGTKIMEQDMKPSSYTNTRPFFLINEKMLIIE
jgi:hypothetical protein